MILGHRRRKQMYGKLLSFSRRQQVLVPLESIKSIIPFYDLINQNRFYIGEAIKEPFRLILFNVLHCSQQQPKLMFHGIRLGNPLII